MQAGAKRATRPRTPSPRHLGALSALPLALHAPTGHNTASSDKATKGIDALPEVEREDAAYEQFEKWLRPLLKMGLRIEVDDQGKTTLGHPKEPGLRMAVPYEDERDKEIMLEMQRRFDLQKSGEKCEAMDTHKMEIE